MYAKIVHILHS